MSYKYWLPDANGNPIEKETESNAVIIIGANGSGKSKLGAWMEQNGFDKIHRVGAQRNLNFSEELQLRSYSDAENLVMYGTPTPEKGDHKGHRWDWGKGYTTKLLDDYNHVLAALLALMHKQNDAFANACYKAGNKTKNAWPNAPVTVLKKLEEIWNLILPERNLIEDDSKFYASSKSGNEEQRYQATQMSDGERAVLYLASQVLCIPEDKILIIDEPEIHLHRSIMNRLWQTLENHRPDCLFIYITHDLDFAAAHGRADKIWVKDFDGKKWTLEKIEAEDIPEELVLEILGSRKNVLFVEGEKNSFDYQLYSQLYSDYLIIPCGSCTQVISKTKAFNASTTLHECKVYGLIDRDYRSEYEIDALRGDHIFTLKVAEVENLFLVEGLIKIIARRLGEIPDQAFDRVKSFVIDTKYSNMINRQICQSVVAEIKYRLSCIDISRKNEEEAKATLDSGLADINYDTIKTDKEAIFQDALNSRDYDRILAVFNEKGTAAAIGAQLGLDPRRYQEIVINLLRGECHEEMTDILIPYLPTEIPRETNGQKGKKE